MLDFSLLLLTAGVALLIGYVYKWATAKWDFFEKQGVAALKPKLFFGNMFDMFFLRVELKEFVSQLYQSFPEEKIFGFFYFKEPIYLVRDPEIYKQLAIKDFDSFEDHNFLVEPEMDALFGNGVFSMRGETWREMRTTLTPAFTGSKMRLMFELVREVALQTSSYLTEITKNGEQTIEIRDTLSRYTNDAIASAAYGVKINSLKDRENYIYLTGQRLLQLNSPKQFIKLFLLRAFPWLKSKWNIQYIDSSIRSMFTSVVLGNIDTRRENKIVRHDLIDLLMRARRKGLFAAYKSNDTETIEKTWSDDEIVAQAFIFFLGGFDTTLWILCAIIYELMLNPSVQQKLTDEIDATVNSLNGKDISYDDLKSMKYLDMVLNEVLRLHLPALFIDRVCTKNYTLNNGEQVIEFKKNDHLWFPIASYQLDPQYHSEPERFDPERFNDENKSQMGPLHFVPFGIGPRSCIGNRFALMEIKGLIFHLLEKFSFNVSPKTKIPLQVSSSPFGLSVKNGLYVNLQPRTK